METLHFIAGLPRSGTTLLAAILKQNPTIDAGMSSPVGAIFNQMLVATSRKNEGANMITPEQRERLLRGIFHSYYADSPPIVFDTNRMWPAKLPALTTLFPESKIIICVREIGWVIDSFERLVQKNPLELSGIFGFQPSGTVFSRATALMAPGGLVGYALDAIRDAYFGQHAKQIIMIDYEALVKMPDDACKLLYQLLELPPYQHDFNNVEYQADEFDKALGTPGLHTVRNKVEWVARQPVIPAGVFNAHKQAEFWRDPKNNVRDVTVIHY